MLVWDLGSEGREQSSSTGWRELRARRSESGCLGFGMQRVTHRRLSFLSCF